jgi:N-methylhydantoinase B/oxoprolinase/acetone carboxylase alpha subunit
MTDAATLSIFNSLLSSVAEEMGAVLGRTALSPNIKERRDYSCAVFDRRGRLVAQAAHIPVHLGAMPVAVEAVRSLAPFAPGDIAILNDPYLGGTHLPDVTMVSPVFSSDAGRRSLIGFVASRAHQADIGGMAPGSMPLASELVQEGLIIPPIKLYRRGRLNQEALSLILRNVRTPEERQGDFEAQVAAQRTGGGTAPGARPALRSQGAKPADEGATGVRGTAYSCNPGPDSRRRVPIRGRPR